MWVRDDPEALSIMRYLMNLEHVLFQIIRSIEGLRAILNSTFMRSRRYMNSPNMPHKVCLTVEVSSIGAALPSALEDRLRIHVTISG